MDDSGHLVAPGNMDQQMKNCYSDLEKVLKHYGYTFDDVIVENVYTTNMADFIKYSTYRNSVYTKQFPPAYPKLPGDEELRLDFFQIVF